jgi:hypothetical protein
LFGSKGGYFKFPNYQIGQLKIGIRTSLNSKTGLLGCIKRFFKIKLRSQCEKMFWIRIENYSKYNIQSNIWSNHMSLKNIKFGFQDLVPSLFCNKHCNGNFQVIRRFLLKWVPIYTPQNMSCFKLLMFQFLFNKSANNTKGCMNHYNLIAPIMHIPKTCSMATKTPTT